MPIFPGNKFFIHQIVFSFLFSSDSLKFLSHPYDLDFYVPSQTQIPKYTILNELR